MKITAMDTSFLFNLPMITNRLEFFRQNIGPSPTITPRIDFDGQLSLTELTEGLMIIMMVAQWIPRLLILHLLIPHPPMSVLTRGMKKQPTYFMTRKFQSQKAKWATLGQVAIAWTLYCADGDHPSLRVST